MDPEQIELAELLRRYVEAGDREALGELYTRSQDRVRQVVVRRLRGFPDIAHAVDEVLSRTWELVMLGAHTYGNQAPVLNWLRVIAAHASMDEVRRRRRRTLLTLDENDQAHDSRAGGEDRLESDLREFRASLSGTLLRCLEIELGEREGKITYRQRHLLKRRVKAYFQTEARPSRRPRPTVPRGQ